MSHSYIQALEKQVEVLREQVKLYAMNFDMIGDEVVKLREEVKKHEPKMIPADDPSVANPEEVVDATKKGAPDVTDKGNPEATN